MGAKKLTEKDIKWIYDKRPRQHTVEYSGEDGIKRQVTYKRSIISQVALAKLFNVTGPTICDIWRGFHHQKITKAKPETRHEKKTSDYIINRGDK